MRPAAGVWLILLAAGVWGTAGAVQELAVPDASPVAVGALRCLLGGAVLAAVASLRRQRIPRDAAVPLAAAAVAMVVFQAGYLGAIRTTGVAVGTLVAIGSAPVWAGLLAAVRGDRPSRGWMLATAVTLGGLVLVVGPGGTTVVGGGVVAALAAGAGYAGYVAAAAVLRGQVPAVATLAVIFVAAGAVLAVAPGGRSVGALDPTALAGHLWLGLGTIAAGYLLFLGGLAHVDAPTATTLTVAEPLTATALAVLVVGEAAGWSLLVGALVLTAGLAAVARSGKLRPRAPG